MGNGLATTLHSDVKALHKSDATDDLIKENYVEKSSDSENDFCVKKNGERRYSLFYTSSDKLCKLCALLD